MRQDIDPTPTVGSGDIALAALSLSGILVAGAAGPRLHSRRLHEAFGLGIAGTVVGVASDVEVAFDLPQGGDFVRLDIAALPGRYRIGGMSINGVVVTGLRSRRVSGACALPPIEGDGDSIRFESHQGRPVIELDVRSLVAGPARIAVSIRRESPPDLQPSVLAGLEDLAAALRREVLASAESEVAIGRQLRAQAAVLHVLAADAQDARQLVSTQRTRIEELLVTTAAMQAGVATLGADLAASAATALQATDAAAQASAAVVERVDALHAQFRATAAASASCTAAGIEAARNDLAVLRTEVAELAALVRGGWLRRALRRLGLRK